MDLAFTVFEKEINIAVMVLLLTACSNKEEVTHAGLNTHILEISKEVFYLVNTDKV